MKTNIRSLLDKRYAARPVRLAARVAARPVDSNGRNLNYVLAEVAGIPGVRVNVGPEAVYYPGDMIQVEQTGGAAAAAYVAVGWVSGARPDAGVMEFTGDTSIGLVDYGAGDLVWGNPFSAHFHLDYSAGQINLRVGSVLTGQIDAGAGTFTAGDPAGLHGTFGATGITFYDGAQALSGWGSDKFWLGPTDGSNQLVYDATAGTLFIGNPAAEHISWDGVNLNITGTINAFGNSSFNLYSDTGAHLAIAEIQEIDSGVPVGTGVHAIRFYDAGGVPRVSILTDDAEYPGQPGFLLGAEDDTSYLRWRGGLLDVKGTVYAEAGQIAGFNLFQNRFTAADGGFTIQTYTGALNRGLYLDSGKVDALDPTAKPGVIHWLKPGTSSPIGIISTWYTEDGSAAEMWLQASGLVDEISGRLTFAASRAGQTARYALTPDHLDLSTAVVKAGMVRGSKHRIMLGAESIIQTTWTGLVARGTNYTDDVDGPSTQLLINGAEVSIRLFWPGQFFTNTQLQCTSLKLHWRKLDGDAYFSSARLCYVLPTSGGNYRFEWVNTANLGQGTAAAKYATSLDIGGNFALFDNYIWYLVLTAELPDPGDIVIYGVELTVEDPLYPF